MNSMTEAKTTSITVEGIEEAPTQYFDGASGILIGPQVSKILFHEAAHSSPNGGSEERRKIKLIAVVPTNALIEMCLNFVNGVAENSNAIREHSNQQLEKIFDAVASRGGSSEKKS